MLKFIGLSAALFTNTLVVLSRAQLSAAQEPDYPCYMISSSGQTVDLSDSVCSSGHTIIHTTNIDDLFLAEYKQAVIKKYPHLNNIFLQQLPEVNIGYAHAVCNGLKSGLSPNIIQTLQTEHIVNTSSGRRNGIDLELISLLAPKYYCPQL